MLGAPSSNLLELTALLQSAQSILPHNLEHSEARHTTPLSKLPDEILLDQRFEQSEPFSPGICTAESPSPLDRFEAELPLEDGERSE